MKLNTAQVARTESQLQAEALPENHPLVPQLNRLFGDHTYFLDRTASVSWSPPAARWNCPRPTSPIPGWSSTLQTGRIRPRQNSKRMNRS